MAQSQANRLAKLEEALREHGVYQTPEKDLDRGVLTRIYQEGVELVDVHLQRDVKTGGIFSKATRKEAIGTYPSVPISELIRNTVEWIHDRVGGGSYVVELTHPEVIDYGVMYRFKIDVPGSPRLPGTLVAKEATFSTSASQATEALAQKLVSAGVPPVTAYQQAQQAIRDNPTLGAMAPAL